MVYEPHGVWVVIHCVWFMNHSVCVCVCACVHACYDSLFVWFMIHSVRGL